MIETPRSDLLIRQGSTEVWVFITRDAEGKHYQATGFRIQVRPTVESSTLLLDLTDADSEVTINPTNVTVRIPDTATDPMPPGCYVYDAEAQEPITGSWWRVVEGKVTVSAQVTR